MAARPGLGPPVGFLSRYPVENEHNWHGIEGYARLLVAELRKGGPVAVLGQKDRRYTRGDDIPVWHDNTVAYDVGKWLIRNRPAVLHIQFDFVLYGRLGVLHILLLLWLCRILGIRTALTYHSLIPKRFLNSEVAGSFGERIPTILLKPVAFFVAVHMRLANAVILHEESQKEAAKSYHPNGIFQVIPIGIETREAQPTGPAKPLRLLFFGNLSPYKGIGPLADAAENLGSAACTLVVAGGLNGRRAADRVYQHFAKSTVRDRANVGLIGFVSDNRLDEVFRAADVVVFPYRNFFGASASLAMALAYGKPVLLSTGAFPDWVKRGLPHCAPTAAALRESILRLASGTELDAAAALSRRYRAKFTWEFSAQETRLLYNWLSREGPQRLSLPAAT